jgi:hypothetical protein
MRAMPRCTQMRRRFTAILHTVQGALLILACSDHSVCSASRGVALAPVSERVAALVARMTTEELVAQTYLRYPCYNGPCISDALNGNLNNTGVGSVSIRCVTNRSGSTAADALGLRNVLQVCSYSTLACALKRGSSSKHAALPQHMCGVALWPPHTT